MSRASDRYFQKWFDERDEADEESATVVMSKSAALQAIAEGLADDDADLEDNPTVIMRGADAEEMFSTLENQGFVLADTWQEPEAQQTLIRPQTDEVLRAASLYSSESTEPPAERLAAPAPPSAFPTIPLGVAAGLLVGITLSGVLVAAVAFATL